MQSLVPLFFIGLFVYLMFFRKGGMGCCGGHVNHEKERQKSINSNNQFNKTEGKVIDLDKNEYKIQR